MQIRIIIDCVLCTAVCLPQFELPFSTNQVANQNLFKEIMVDHENLLKMCLPLGNPRICREWVPSEWKNKLLIQNHNNSQDNSSSLNDILWTVCMLLRTNSDRDVTINCELVKNVFKYVTVQIGWDAKPFSQRFFKKTYLPYLLIIRITFFSHKQPFVKQKCSSDVKGSLWNKKVILWHREAPLFLRVYATSLFGSWLKRSGCLTF